MTTTTTTKKKKNKRHRNRQTTNSFVDSSMSKPPDQFIVVEFSSAFWKPSWIVFFCQGGCGSAGLNSNQLPAGSLAGTFLRPKP